MLENKKESLRKIKIYSIVITACAVIIGTLAVLLSWQFLGKQEIVVKPADSEIDREVTAEAEAPKNQTRRAIDGVLVEEGEENPYPVAIIIENHFEARPLSGISQANLVIEAPVEGNISRYLVVYASNAEVPAIGPVRSARPYYLDWTKELGALYLHVGGSAEALKKIKQYDIFNLDQYYNWQYYWRTQKRWSPHDVYTSSELFKRALEDLGAAQTGNFKSWRYKEEASLPARPLETKQMVVDYAVPEYKINWNYDRDSNSYLRFVMGQAERDSNNNEQVKTKNIAVQYVKVEVLDEIGRRQIDTIGEGEAVVFQDGKSIAGHWRKEDRSERTRFYDADWQELEFNAGLTWVEVVPKELKVEY